jgi:hypothetical protein
MRTVLVVVCSAMAGFGMAASPVLAKTVKECQAEWRSHKDVFEQKGISEYDYVDECRGYPAPALQTSAVAQPAPTTAAPAPVKPAHVAVAAPVAPGHPSTEAGVAKPKKPEATSRISSRDEFNSKLAHELDRSAHKSNPQLVSSPPPARENAPESCFTRHSGTIIHSERCGF